MADWALNTNGKIVQTTKDKNDPDVRLFTEAVAAHNQEVTRAENV